MQEIFWPDKFLPGYTDNFVSNEVIVRDVPYQAVLDNLLDASKWPGYYSNCADIHMYNQEDTMLREGTRFRFKTFGFDVESEVIQCSVSDRLLRLSWHGWNEAEGDGHLEVCHAWIVEKLNGNRLRVLTQESQLGVPAKKMADSTPNTMLNGHQEWLTGLSRASRGEI